MASTSLSGQRAAGSGQRVCLPLPAIPSVPPRRVSRPCLRSRYDYADSDERECADADPYGIRTEQMRRNRERDDENDPPHQGNIEPLHVVVTSGLRRSNAGAMGVVAQSGLRDGESICQSTGDVYPERTRCRVTGMALEPRDSPPSLPQPATGNGQRV